MPKSFECPSCDAAVMTTGIPAGTSMRCPVCQAKVKVPADGSDDDDDDDRDDYEEEDEPRRRRPRRGRNDRGRTQAAGSSLGLWLGIGGAVLAVVVVLVIVLGRKKPTDQVVDKPGDPAPQAKEGGGSDAYTVARRIDTNIPLPRREPYILVRGILALNASADAGVIAVTSALSPRRYTINRATGKVIAEFDEPDAKDPWDAQAGRDVYRGEAIISPDGKLLIVKFSLEILVRTIKVRDVATGNVVKTLGDAKMHHFHRLAFSPKGDILYAIAHVPGELVLVGWTVANWQEVCRIKIPENREPGDLIPLADGKTVVTLTRALGPRKAQADFFDVREQKFTRAFVLASWKETRVLAASPDGKLLAVVGDNGEFNRALEVYDMDTSKHISTVAESKDITQPGGPPDDSFPQVYDLRFLPGGRIGVVGGHSTTGSFAATYDARTGAQKAIWKHDNEIGGRKLTHLSFCANGELMMVLDGTAATILFAKLKE